MRLCLIAAAALTVAGCHSTTGGHPVTPPRDLSHLAVEDYITHKLDVTGVVCNDGRNFPMVANGTSFTCTDDGGHTYTVTIKNKLTGDYEVR